MLIAQITDTHIVEKGKDWLGKPMADTAGRLSLTIKKLNDLKPAPDLLIVSGDLVESGKEEEYQHIKELLSYLKMPYYILPGNHDDRDNIRKVFNHASYLPSSGFLHYVLNFDQLKIIALDTMVPMSAKGELCEERLNWLEQQLLKDLHKPTLIFMHHPPVTVGQKIFDSIICFSSKRFETMLAARNNLLGIACGHYHKAMNTSFAGKLLFLAPSTAPIHHFIDARDDKVSGIELVDPCLTLHKIIDNRLASEIINVKSSDYILAGYKH